MQQTPRHGRDQYTSLDAALQLARSRVPVSSLTVLEPHPRWKRPLVFEDGAYDYAGTPPEAVGCKVRATPHCKQVLPLHIFIQQRCAARPRIFHPYPSTVCLAPYIAVLKTNVPMQPCLLWMCTSAMCEKQQRWHWVVLPHKSLFLSGPHLVTCSVVLQITQLLATTTFQQYSGPVLQHVEFSGRSSFECFFELAAPPETYPVRFPPTNLHC